MQQIHTIRPPLGRVRSSALSPSSITMPQTIECERADNFGSLLRVGSVLAAGQHSNGGRQAGGHRGPPWGRRGSGPPSPSSASSPAPRPRTAWWGGGWRAGVIVRGTNWWKTLVSSVACFFLPFLCRAFFVSPLSPAHVRNIGIVKTSNNTRKKCSLGVIDFIQRHQNRTVAFLPCLFPSLCGYGEFQNKNGFFFDMVHTF